MYSSINIVYEENVLLDFKLVPQNICAFQYNTLKTQAISHRMEKAGTG